MHALIFDFDGLILDTETPEYKIWRDVFTEHGVEMPDGYWASLIGRGAEQETERPPKLLSRLTGLDADEHSLRRGPRARILELILLETVRPGVIELLDEADAAGVPVAVASSSRHEWVDVHLTRLGLLSRFQAVLCADDVARAKPYPDLYLAACDAVGVDPARAIALEDSPNGAKAARAAGLYTVVVPNSVTEEFEFPESDLRLGSLSDVSLAKLLDTAFGTRA